MLKKTIISYFCIIVFISTSAFSQVRIHTKHRKEYTGLILHDKNDTLKFKTIEGDEIKIPKEELIGMKNLQTLIATTSGKKFKGNIESENDSTILIKSKNGTENIILKNEISTRTILIQDNYSIAGLTYGNPGGVNLLCGYHFYDFGLKGEIGFFPLDIVHFGYQFNLFYNLSKTETFEQNVSFGAGFSGSYGGSMSVPVLQNKFNNKNLLISSINKIEVLPGVFSKENESGFQWNFIGLYYDLIWRVFFFEAGITFGTGELTNPQISIQVGLVFRNLY